MKKSKRKSVICFMVIFLIFLGGCQYSLWKDTEDAQLIYEGNSYHFEHNWSPIEWESYTIGKAIWQGYEHTVRVYNDPQKRFIFDEYFQEIYHKETDHLPNLEDVSSVEKIVFFSYADGSEMTLDSELVVDAVVSLISQPYQTSSFENSSLSKLKIAQVDVYFYDYPAYYVGIASVIQTQDGVYGFVMSDWDEDDCNYIPIPSNSSILSIFE